MYEDLIKILKDSAKTPGRDEVSNAYHGNDHKNYLLRVPTVRKIAKDFARVNKDIEINELVKVLNSLNKSDYYEEKCLVGHILEYLPKQRGKIDPKNLNSWLENIEGWAEIDSLCYGAFGASDMLDNWEAWEKLLRGFNKSKFIQKRRASIVLLTKPVSQSDDRRLEKIAFENIDNLKSERDILITKAISWLLRSLVQYHKSEVAEYLEENKESLPKIAIRETLNKLKTGKK